MTQQNYPPPPPGWGPPQQPGWGTPPQQPNWGPPPPRPPKKPNVAQIITLCCAGVVALFIVALIIGAAVGDDEGTGSADAGNHKSGKPAATVPHYEIVKQDTSGNTRAIVIEVDTTKNLRAVFDDVTKDLTDEAGYWVSINCSTGGTSSVDNRLANGRYAIGRMGAAATGLKDRGSEFSTNDDRTCPDTN